LLLFNDVKLEMKINVLHLDIDKNLNNTDIFGLIRIEY